MYISKIKIKNFRNFNNSEQNIIKFNEGLNVIVGHNNAGKSNVIRALSLIFNPSIKKQLEIDDFNKNISLDVLKESPPKITVEVTISQSTFENLMSDDLVTISNWLIKLEEPYEAKLTYEYFLPLNEIEHYNSMISSSESQNEAWKIIQDEFLRKYTYKIWGGKPENKTTVDTESLSKFDFQFLDAIRDVERDMFTGKNTLLKNVVDFFMDYGIKSDITKLEEVREREIKKKKQSFSSEAERLVNILQSRMKDGKKEILAYARDIGASFDQSEPDFKADITDVELYSALKLIVKYKGGVDIPVSHNGLGYNNLIFMSLLLSKMQINSDGEYLGSNAKAFPILVIEEPEAHLHPSMQFQFLNFLEENRKKNKVRQVFITSHSTHIVATAGLDNVICLYKNGEEISVSYPGKVFSKDKSKKYVERFLDATKSDMLFADKVIFVEGIAEQLLLSIFARYLGKSLEKNHVAVINVGGRYFEHFLSLFDGAKENAINRKVACLTDIDPTRKKKQKYERHKKCYPYEYGVDEDTYEYSQNTNLHKYQDQTEHNIRSFTQSEKYGKTFEYELVLSNPSLELLITDSTSNRDELKNLMEAYSDNKTLDELKDLLEKTEENNRIKEAIDNTPDDWDEDDKKRALIASRYLNSVGKGENALELAYNLEENLNKKDSEKSNYAKFTVPGYIQRAIEWVCDG